ncbi:MAG: protein phosphatase 2C domain-containing protein [Abitibacteriaceae bacterium]|nr:protein phosphatase 2C domain-containing protein [Abditibacteriaceae bacterium]
MTTEPSNASNAGLLPPTENNTSESGATASGDQQNTQATWANQDPTATTNVPVAPANAQAADVTAAQSTGQATVEEPATTEEQGAALAQNPLADPAATQNTLPPTTLQAELAAENQNVAAPVETANPTAAVAAASVPSQVQSQELLEAQAPPALPKNPLPEPPRALVPGAFLRLEFEIKQVLVRGFTNLYFAQAGDYGATVPKLIAEREVPSIPAAAPVTATAASTSTAGTTSAAAVDPQVATPQATPGSGQAISSEDEQEMTSGAMLQEAIADQTTLGSNTAVESQSQTHPQEITPLEATPPELNETLQAALFPPCEKFVQEDREYQVFDFANTTAMQDYREPSNDVRYLQVLDALARGLAELENRKLHAALTRDTLRFDDKGTLHYYGFFDVQPPINGESLAATPDATETLPPLEQLREINSFLLKRVFAESSTMRLGDEFGSLCLSEEVKELARRLHEHEYTTVQQVVEAIAALYQPGTTLQVDAALLSDVGQERELNEDSGMIIRLQRAAHLGAYQYDLYVVADGMGGHEGGEVASNLTLASLQRNLATRSGINWGDNVAVKQALLEVIDAVNADVVALNETPHYRMMRAKPGSTLVFAVRVGSRVFIGNVGDSRAYKYNQEGGLQRISKDHSYVQTLVDRGEITEDEAWDHPEGSIITANIGDPRLRTRDVFVRLFAPGDTLLLVSDGVVDMLRDREIETYLSGPDAATICRNLVDASNAAGGGDNITTVCATFAA